jgi:hypothetical protein
MRSVVTVERHEETTVSVEEEKTRAWRFDQFDALGFSPDDSTKLATVGADWHRVARMLHNGATHDQVRRILL